MKPLILSLERLQRIQSTLRKHNGILSIRDMERSYSLYRWEVEQAAALGWLEIVPRKPRVGRTSLTVREVNRTCGAKLPPSAKQITRCIPLRHLLFIIRTTVCVRWGRRSHMRIGCMADAYQQTYLHASRRACCAGASRLLRRPEIKAAIRWLRAQFDGRIPKHKILPNHIDDIRADLVEAGLD